MIRQQLIEELTREIMNYDAEYRREDAAGGIGVSRTALDLGRGERAKHVPRSQSEVTREVRPGVRWPGGVGFSEKRGPPQKYRRPKIGA